jgi:dolichyl-phosphate-mannose-protein mannosyltransferase
MSEEKARRRLKASTTPIGEQEKERYGEYYDDEGKDVYSKIRPKSARLSSGRLPQLPSPPPTSVVSTFFFFFFVETQN